MSKISIQTEVDFKSLLAGIGNLQIKDLESFSRELNALITRKKTKDKNYRAAELLKKHNQTVLPIEKQRRFMELKEKLESEKISELERNEFKTLSKTSAELRNQRVKILIELAQIKNVTFPHLMQELGLKEIPH